MPIKTTLTGYTPAMHAERVRAKIRAHVDDTVALLAQRRGWLVRALAELAEHEAAAGDTDTGRQAWTAERAALTERLADAFAGRR
jgi:hypothetical protein